MAESIVEKIKQKMAGIQLPFLKKKAPIEADAAVSSTDKTNIGIQAPPPDDATEANDLNDMEAPAKPKMVLFRPIGKTKFTPVHVIVVLGVLYFGYDMMMGEDASEEVAQETVAPPKPKRKRKKPGEETATPRDTVTAGTTPAATPEATPAADGSAPVDNIDVAQVTPAPEVKPTQDPIDPDDPMAIDSIDVKAINTAAEKIELEETTKPKETPAPVAAEVPADSSAGGEEGTITTNTGEASSADVSPEPVKESDLASDLLKNLSDTEEPKSDEVAKENKESTSPPDYTRIGRGLVYNCKDGHWACVARDEYLTCKSNRKWNESNSKKKECFEVSVYATDRDCATAQKIKVDSVAQTDFCK